MRGVDVEERSGRCAGRADVAIEIANAGRKRRALHLARRFGEGPITGREIAEAEQLPGDYVEQILLRLRRSGIVRSTRGAHGGYELARAPELIVMGEVLRALEGPIAPMICASDDPNHVTCVRTGYCMVNFMWIRVRDAIAGALDSMTLADLVPRVARLAGSGLPILPTATTATTAAATVIAD